MKNIIIAISFISFFSACSATKKLKTNYEVLDDKGNKMFKGIINRSLVENDTAFAWFKESMQYGKPNEAAVNAFKQNQSKFTMLIFGGTWCEDTQNLLPRFYQLVDKSGFPEIKVTLIAVDRQKTTLNNLHTTYNIINVPTFIVLKDGKEVGRVVEYGKGDMVKELGEIVGKL